jgi:predicted nucleic acid-binding protein
VTDVTAKAVCAALKRIGSTTRLPSRQPWFNRRDRHHARVRAYLDHFRGELVTTWPVLVETVHLLPTRLEVAFLQWVNAGGVTIHEMPPSSIATIAALVSKYADNAMDVTDASLLWLADKSAVSDMLTIDDAHFSAYRTPGGKALRNLI